MEFLKSGYQSDALQSEPRTPRREEVKRGHFQELIAEAGRADPHPQALQPPGRIRGNTGCPQERSIHSVCRTCFTYFPKYTLLYNLGVRLGQPGFQNPAALWAKVTKGPQRPPAPNARHEFASRLKKYYIQFMGKTNIKRNSKTHRTLGDLISIGPAMVADFKLLGVGSVADLARQDPDRLYKKLCRITGQHHDICVLDTFRAGVAQARNPRLPAEQCQWWYWSRRRKSADSARSKG